VEEMEQIRDRYMGVERKKRKIRRMNDRRFVFDWDEGEDTSVDANPLYKHCIEYNAFGRGHLGGVDPDDKEYVLLLHFRGKIKIVRDGNARCVCMYYVLCI
jgi:ATP-dependent RNA helicase DDX23/PRP28